MKFSIIKNQNITMKTELLQSLLYVLIVTCMKSSSAFNISEICKSEPGRTLKCEADFSQEYDIEQIFEELEFETISDWEYDVLLWRVNVINQTIPAHVFRNFSFGKVYWNAPLEKIHVDAFASADRGFSWSNLDGGNSNLTDYPGTDFDIYKAFLKIKDPVFLEIHLSDYHGSEIPDNAFNNKNWNRITNITFHSTREISRIGDNIIHDLPDSINSINFGYYFDRKKKMKNIERDAFKVQPCSHDYCEPLYISLNYSYLNNDDLKVGMFDIKSRTVHLNLGKFSSGLAKRLIDKKPKPNICPIMANLVENSVILLEFFGNLGKLTLVID